MKLFGLLSALTIVLVVVGFRTGSFSGSDAEPIDTTATAATDESASCCASGTCSCKTGGETTECTGSCAEGGTCCQEEGVSRSSLMMASTAAEPAPGGLVQEESNEAAGIVGDWAMWGGALSRNMASDATGINIDFDLRAGQNVNWVANLGSQTYGNAIVAGGKVFVGCNNGAEYRPGHVGDRGCLLCFDEESGEFLWQLTREKLTSGRVNDWPLQGICSTPSIELSVTEEEGDDGRLWVVTNRCELMCIDISGFADGNDGLTDEVDQEMEDADIIWNLDMINELGVFPHNLATSSPLVYEDMVYVLTSNGVDEAHLELPSPRAPSFLAVNKDTGEVVWESNAPFDQVLHGQWGSPTMGMVNGQAQIYFPGGDGWLYALDAKTGEEIWKFDMNPKDSLWELGGAGSRNAVIATGVFRDNSLLIAVGQDPEHGEGVGHLWRIDCTKTGDISPEIGEIGEVGEVNPDSGVIWHYGGSDDTGEVTGREGRSIFRRTMSTVAIADGMVFAADLSGFVHCIDYESGERHWEHDLFSGVWGSPMVADGKMFIGTEDGSLVVLEANPAEVNVMKVLDTINNSSIYSTPTIANGNMYITDRTRLYSVKIQDKDE